MVTPHRVTPIFTTIQRFRDWEAHATGDPKRWEAGRTEAEAIGKLMITLASSGNAPELAQARTADDVLNSPRPGDPICVPAGADVPTDTTTDRPVESGDAAPTLPSVLIDRSAVIEQWGCVFSRDSFPARTYPDGVPLHVLLTELQCPAFVDRWPESAKTAFVDGFGDLGDPGKDVQGTWSRMLRAADECTTEGAYSAVCGLRDRAMRAAIAVLKG